MKNTLKLLFKNEPNSNINIINSNNIKHLSANNMEHPPVLVQNNPIQSNPNSTTNITQTDSVIPSVSDNTELPTSSDADEVYIKKLKDNFDKFKKDYNKQFEDTKALYKKIGYDEEQILKTMYLKDLF